MCNLRRFGYLIASLSQSQKCSGGLNFFKYDANKALFIAVKTNKEEQLNSSELEKQKIEEGQSVLKTNEETKTQSKLDVSIYNEDSL